MYHHVSKMLESMKTVWRSWISSAKHVDTLEITTGIRIFTFAALLYALSGSIRPNATTPSGQIYHCLNPLLYFPPWAVSSPCESSATYERTTNGISGDERVRTHTILNIAHVRRRSSCVRTWLSGCVGRLLKRWPRSTAWRQRTVPIIIEPPDDIMTAFWKWGNLFLNCGY